MARAGTAWIDVLADFSKYKRQLAEETHKRVTQDVHVQANTSSLRRAHNDVESFGASLNRHRPNVDRFAQSTMKLVGTAAKITAVGIGAEAVSALGAAAVATTASLGPLTGALAATPALASAGAQAVGTWKLAFSGVTTAVGGLNERLDQNSKAFRELTPEGKKFALELERMKKPLRELSETSQKGLLPGLTRGIKESMANFHVLQRGVGDTARVMGDLAEQAGKLLGSRSFGRDLQTQMARNDVTIRRVGTAGLLLVDALRHIVIAAGPLTDWLTRTVVGWARVIDRWALGARKSGELTRMFAETRRVMQTVFQISGNLGTALFNIFKLAYPTGKSFLELQVSLSRHFADWTRSAGGRNRIREFFEQSRPAMVEAEKLVIAIFKSFGRLAEGATVAPLLRTLRVDLLPAFEKLVKSTTASFGPEFIEALKQSLLLFTKIGGSSGPLVLFVESMGQAAKFLNTLIDRFPILGKAIVTVGAIASISKMLGITQAIGGMTRLVTQVKLIRTLQAQGAGSATIMALTGETPTKGAVGGSGAAAGVSGAVAGASASGWRSGLSRAIPFVKAGLYTAVAVSALSGLMNAASSHGLKRTLNNTMQDFVSGATFGLAKSSKGVASDVARDLAKSISGPIFGPASAAPKGAPVFKVHASFYWTKQDEASYRTWIDYLRKSGRLTAEQATALRRLAATRTVLEPWLQDLRSAAGIRIDFRRAIKMDPAALRTMRVSFNLLAGAASGVSHTLGDLRATSSRNLKAIASTLGTNTAAGRRAVQRNFDLISQAITGDLRSGRISTGRYMKGMQDTITDASRKSGHAVGSAFNGINNSIYNAMRGGLINSRKYMKLIRQEIADMGGLSAADAHTAFTSIANSIRNAMHTGQVSTKAGMAAIHKAWVAELKAYGISESQATRPEAGGTIGAGPRGGRARGGKLFTGGVPNPAGSKRDDHVVVGPDGTPIAMISGTEEIVTGPQSRIANAAMAYAYASGLVPYPSMDAMYGRPELQHRNRGGPLRRYASGGGLNPGINAAAQAVLRQFPALMITSTTGGTHAPGSYHYSGNAVDISGDGGTMFRAAAWILNTMGRSLTEGIHNPNLSVKFGKQVPPSYWGAATWAGHADHIHLAIVGALKALGLAGGAVDLPHPKTKAKGWPGMLSQRVIDLDYNAAKKNLENALASTGGGDLPGTSMSGPWVDVLKRIAAANHWSAADWLWIVQHESGGNPASVNPSSGATGLGQMLGGNIAMYDGRGTPAQQIAGMGRYIRDRYGNPTAAKAFWQAHNWYQRGGRLRRYAPGGSLPGRSGLPQYRVARPRAPSLPSYAVSAIRALAYATSSTRAGKAAAARGAAASSALTRKLGRAVDMKQFAAYTGPIGRLEHAVNLDAVLAEAAGNVTDSQKISDALLADMSWQQPGLSVAQQHAIQDHIIDTVLPRIQGRNQLEHLVQQVTDMAELRNYYIRFEAALKVVVEKLKATVAALEAQLKRIATQLVNLKNRRTSLLNQAKAKGVSAARKRLLNAQAAELLNGVHGINTLTRQQKAGQSSVATLNKGISAMRVAGGWGDHGSDSAWGRLYSLAGPVPNMDRRLSASEIFAGDAAAPGSMVLGDMFGVLNAIRPFRSSLYQTLPDTTSTQDSSATGPTVDQWALSLSQANVLRGVRDVHALQLDVLRGILSAAPFGGSFAAGGVVPGPTGSPRVIVAHGGEVVTRAEDAAAGTEVHLHFHGSARELQRMMDVRIDQRTGAQARAAARRLPGSGLAR